VALDIAYGLVREEAPEFVSAEVVKEKVRMSASRNWLSICSLVEMICSSDIRSA
jgi:hypothetical protein